MSIEYRDRQGKKITEFQHHVLRDNDEYTTVASTEFGNYRIDTKWDGYSFSDTPGIFVTKIWDLEHRKNYGALFRNAPTERYNTEDAARAGHEAAVNLIRALYGRAENGESNMIDRVHAAIRGDKDTPEAWASARQSRKSRSWF